MYFNRLFTITATFFLVLFLTSTVLAEETITFQLLRGRAALNRQGVGNWLDLGPEPLVIRVQDRLRTEGETRGEMKFPDGSIFRVKSNTILTLMDGGIQLQVGEAIFNLQKQGRTFQVVTPTAVCGVLGTSFDVNVDRFGKTQVRVFDGIVAVKTHGQERRQLVLQRGMMTAVQREGAVESKPQRFDPATIEGQMKKEWGGTTPLKVGPARPQMNVPRQPQEGLPPLRDGEKPPLQPGTDPRQPGLAPGVPGARDQINGLPPLRKSELNPAGEGQGFRPTSPSAPPTAPTPGSSIRDNMSFFETLQRQQNPNRMPTPSVGAAGDGSLLRPERPQPGETKLGYADPGNRPLNSGQIQEGHGRSFGQAGPGLLGAQDPQRIREELNLIQNQLVRINEEIARTDTEIKQVRQQLAQVALVRSRTTTSTTTTTRTAITLPGALPTSTPTTTPTGGFTPATPGTTTTTGVSPSQLQERLRALEERLRVLRDQQQKLLIRLNDVRNRLH